MIRRASMNSHDWIGGISNIKFKGDKMTYKLGVDLRSYKGYHYRAMNNLMGLDGYFSTGNDNNSGQIVETTIEASPFKNTGIRGPKINYYNNGIVKWAGFNAMAEYTDDKLSAVLQLGTSNQSFQREDFFAQTTNPISDKRTLEEAMLKGSQLQL